MSRSHCLGPLKSIGKALALSLEANKFYLDSLPKADEISRTSEIRLQLLVASQLPFHDGIFMEFCSNFVPTMLTSLFSR